MLSDGTLGAVGVSGRAGYSSYVPLSSSLGTLGELGALCPPMEFGRGVQVAGWLLRLVQTPVGDGLLGKLAGVWHEFSGQLSRSLVTAMWLLSSEHLREAWKSNLQNAGQLMTAWSPGPGHRQAVVSRRGVVMWSA